MDMTVLLLIEGNMSNISVTVLTPMLRIPMHAIIQ